MVFHHDNGTYAFCGGRMGDHEAGYLSAQAFD
jgi:hypothetical protein